ncbi:hypothetical protein [Burkholderia ubonensis]|uniref:hypothetical protein n=1 Tax=Burkholderia ubonensis TaxID=101571 RepID=UPI0012F8823E|nr:hypothetical protein [Burkholderia ubonensis]
MTKRTNNFAGYQAGLVETHLRRIEAELKDIAGRSRLEFKDFDRLVNYVSKVTSLHEPVRIFVGEAVEQIVSHAPA